MKRKACLFLSFICLSIVNVAAQILVTGKVVEDDGEPVIGATVAVPKTNIGTITDIDGTFSLELNNTSQDLQVSFVGMKSKTITVGKKRQFVITLEDDFVELEEVVAVGYGTVIKKSDLTGSVASVRSEDIEKRKTVSAIEGLQGQIAGVNIITESGEPGGGMSMVIRGGNSVNSDNQPLYVIDGVQIEANSGEMASGSFGSMSTFSPLASISPSDIASIEVLKDASATAIYGSRGANGVVIITTKKGTAGRTSVTFDTSVGVSVISKKLDVLDGVEYGHMRYEIDPDNTTYGVDTDGDGVLDMAKDFSDSTSVNWQDEAIREAITQSYSLSITGGTKATTYSSNISYANNEGIIKGTGYERFATRVDLAHQVTSYLKVGTNLNATYSENEGAALSGGNGDYNGLFQSIIVYNPLRITDLNETELAGLTTPYTMLSDAYKNASFSRVMGNVFAEIKLNNKFNIRSTFGGVYTDSKAKEFYGKETGWGKSSNGKAILSGVKSKSIFSRNIVNYNNTFGDHRLGLQGAFEVERYNFENYKVEATGFEIEYTGIDDLSKALESKIPSTFRSENARMSYMARVNYGYDSRYLLTASMRADGSSRFSCENKWGYFPSLAFAWRINEESFLKQYDDISNIKLRLSAGSTGNDRIPVGVNYNQAITTDYASGGSIDKGISAVYIANPDLKWETTYQYNVGFDLGFFNSRLTSTIDLYYKKTNDMLINADIPTIKGQAKQWMNLGSVENKGLELSVSSVNFEKQNFQWTTNFNITFNRNKILSLGNVDEIPVTIGGGHMQEVARLMVGQPIGTAYGYVYDGVYQKRDFSKVLDSRGNEVSMDEVEWSKRDTYTFVLKDGVVHNSNAPARPGDFKYKDLSGDNVIDAQNDRRAISNSNPNHYGSITNTFKLYDFDFSFMFRWSAGNEVYNASRLIYEAGDANHFNVGQDYWDNRWTPENSTNKYGSTKNNMAKDVSSYYVEDASFLRLQNVSLGYTLPKRLTRKIKIENLRFYVVANNLWVLTSYTGFDPEVKFNNASLTGLDRFVYPRPITTTVGMSLAF